MATNEHRRRTGSATALPLPDDSLSAGSAAMIQHLRSTGVDVPINPLNPESVQTNEISQDRGSRSMYVKGQVEARSLNMASPEERAAGFKTAKDVLRSARRVQTNPVQFGSATGEQLRLF
jgi:hypothetical protein